MGETGSGPGGGAGAIRDAGFELVSRRLGAFPLVDHFLARAGVPALLARYLPAEDARYRLAPATAIGLVVATCWPAGSRSTGWVSGRPATSRPRWGAGPSRPARPAPG